MTVEIIVVTRGEGVNETGSHHLRRRAFRDTARSEGGGLALHHYLVVSSETPGAKVELLGFAIPDDCRTLYVCEPPGPSAFIRVADVVS